ncbi:hypothetical protein [Streptomyces qinzhouensis]|uniref:Uncharacterized protein n=1 Tax=Streptomyces qinzhouensis TaxID=2599401 RepID=A0A5B8J8M5_9ACTN|nr:hypothetical protein [Streptomyces qinzhouensis]QDY77677.1 hypothetical protein FQU76_15395 [Streptomyces qinzhouensis]
MAIHVCPSTIEAIMRTVDEEGGAALIKNARVKSLEGRDRLRMERLQRVYQLLHRRGLNCYPKRPSCPDEWWSFAVYRPELVTVDLSAIGTDPELSTLMERVLNAFRHPYSHADAPYVGSFVGALRKLNAARPAQPGAEQRRLHVA